jgi:hypothetical protein
MLLQVPYNIEPQDLSPGVERPAWYGHVVPIDIDTGFVAGSCFVTWQGFCIHALSHPLMILIQPGFWRSLGERCR